MSEIARDACDEYEHERNEENSPSCSARYGAFLVDTVSELIMSRDVGILFKEFVSRRKRRWGRSEHRYLNFYGFYERIKEREWANECGVGCEGSLWGRGDLKTQCATEGNTALLVMCQIGSTLTPVMANNKMSCAHQIRL